ncbi:hypothetical protein LPJ73_003518 [Coemansia sp. RSA 2703]|nr:hypothetical protein LPJ73_003518 [Coemansia sp. RSA 2703]
MIEKSDLIAAVYNNSPMPQINEDKYRESLPRPSSASSGQRQSQGSNGRGRSRSNDNEGVSGSWDRMFNTIGGEIGRGMDHIAEGLSNAFEARPSSAQRQHYQQPSFFQPPPPPTPPYPPQPPQQQFQFESQNRNSSQQSQQGFRSHGQSQGHSSSTSSENYGFNFSSDSGNRSAGGNSFNQPYHHSWQTQSRSQSHTHNSSHSDGPGPRGTRNESQQNQQHSSSTADVPDLRELVRSSKDIKTLSVKTLKALLVKNHIDHAGIVEKQELVQKVERLVANVKLEMEQERAAEADTEASQTHSNGPTSNISSGPDDNLCKICWDAATNVVFTPCGHLCTCLECTETIMRQERRECPICREFIRDYIRVFRA